MYFGFPAGTSLQVTRLECRIDTGPTSVRLNTLVNSTTTAHADAQSQLRELQVKYPQEARQWVDGAYSCVLNNIEHLFYGSIPIGIRCDVWPQLSHLLSLNKVTKR